MHTQIKVSNVVSVEEAWKTLQGALKPGGVESVDLHRAFGRVLSCDILSPQDIPSENLAMMDGYALRVKDLEFVPDLKVVGVVRAGEVWEGAVGRGQSARVMTGAPLPRGTNAVLPMEDAEHSREGWIRGLRSPSIWANVVRRGEYARGGDRLLTEGERLEPEGLAILAGIGLRKVRVRKRPRLGVLITGSELVSSRGDRRRGQIFASHGAYLRAVVEAEGARAILMDPVPDDTERLAMAICHFPNADLLLTTGGTGGGDGDLLFRTMTELGASVLFRGIRMRPGRTTALYRVGRRPILSLPGGIGGVQIGFEVLVRPAIHWLQGESSWACPKVRCFTEVSLPQDPNGYRFLEAWVWDQPGRLTTAALPKGPRGGGLPARSAQGWIEIPPGDLTIPSGSCVSVRLKGKGLNFHAAGAEEGTMRNDA